MNRHLKRNSAIVDGLKKWLSAPALTISGVQALTGFSRMHVLRKLETGSYDSRGGEIDVKSVLQHHEKTVLRLSGVGKLKCKAKPISKVQKVLLPKVVSSSKPAA
jgi:hypothetical protein